VAGYLENVDELLENMRTGSNPEYTRALKGTVLLPLTDAVLAE
jgi:hypothetical protein